MTSSTAKLILTAYDERPFYVESLKHEIQQAFYRHHELIFESEVNNLAMEIFLRSYSHSDMSKMAQNEDIITFNTDSIAFFLEGNNEPVRLDMGCSMPIPADHSPITLKSDDELAIHYRDILFRMSLHRDSDELLQLVSRVDALSKRLGVAAFFRESKQISSVVKNAYRQLDK